MMRRSPATVWVGVRDGFRTQLWPLPSAAVALAIVVAVGLPRLEKAHEVRLPQSLRSYLFTGGADAARTVLDAVAGSLITVTALTFSLTVVTLQLASSQFSPRLLRTFTRDLVVQGTLGLFLGTFTYALTVLRVVRTSSSSHAEFVPDIAVTLAYVLSIASVIGLIFFLAHLAQTIRVESMLRSVREDASDSLRRELKDADDDLSTFESLIPRGSPNVLEAASSGFLVRIEEQNLLEAATKADAVVVLDVVPGTWLVAHTPVGGAWWPPDRTRARDDSTSAELTEAISATLVTGFERTSVQDVSLGLRQLTDVAVKALSPGINDPTTAIHALAHSSTLLAEFVGRDLGPKVLRDSDGLIRVVLARPDLATLLALATDQPARYGASDPAVLHRLFGLLRELAWVCAPHQRLVVTDALARLRRLVAQQEFDDEDVALLTRSAAQVESALEGRWDVGSRA